MERGGDAARRNRLGEARDGSPRELDEGGVEQGSILTLQQANAAEIAR